MHHLEGPTFVREPHDEDGETSAEGVYGSTAEDRPPPARLARWVRALTTPEVLSRLSKSQRAAAKAVAELAAEILQGAEYPPDLIAEAARRAGVSRDSVDALRSILLDSNLPR